MAGGQRSLGWTLLPDKGAMCLSAPIPGHLSGTVAPDTASSPSSSVAKLLTVFIAASLTSKPGRGLPGVP